MFRVHMVHIAGMDSLYVPHAMKQNHTALVALTENTVHSCT